MVNAPSAELPAARAVLGAPFTTAPSLLSALVVLGTSLALSGCIVGHPWNGVASIKNESKQQLAKVTLTVTQGVPSSSAPGARPITEHAYSIESMASGETKEIEYDIEGEYSLDVQVAYTDGHTLENAYGYVDDTNRLRLRPLQTIVIGDTSVTVNGEPDKVIVPAATKTRDAYDGNTVRDLIEPIAGGIYATKAAGNTFGIAKVLVVQGNGVHVRLYKNTYETLPTSIDERTLALGDLRKGGTPGIGHLPLTRQAFEHLSPVFIQQSTVSPDELDGYNIWKEGGGQLWYAPGKATRWTEERWSLGSGDIDGKPATTRTLSLDSPIADYTVRLGFATKSSVAFGVQNDPGEYDRLIGIEDGIERSVSAEDCLFVAELTTPGVREFVYYAPSKEVAERRAQRALKDQPSLRYYVKDDPEWNAYRMLRGETKG